MKIFKNIVITGASGGLGAALSAYYAAPGVTLHLHGRNAAKLDAVAEHCKNKGALVHCTLADVTDREAMERWLASADKTAPIDLVIANAGISAGTGLHGETGTQLRDIFATNIEGTVNTIQPLIAAMAARRKGQIAIVSSLAGIRGLPSSPAYSASKACVRYWGEGLRGWLAPQGVGVSVICPGYIKTPMTDINDFPMPFIMSAEKAARIIGAGLSKNKSRIAFPRALYWPLWWLSCLSPFLTDPVFARLPAKPSIADFPKGGTSS